MSEYTLGLCLLDFVPNLAFLAGAVFLVRLVMLRTDRTCQIATIAGSALVFLGGTLKAVWKLLESGRWPVTEVSVPGDVPIDVDTWHDYERLIEASP